MKKPYLIDDLEEFSNNTANFKVNLNGIVYSFWQIAKPMINNGFFTRLYHAWLVLTGKAQAFQFFEDLNKKQQSNWFDLEKKRRILNDK